MSASGEDLVLFYLMVEKSADEHMSGGIEGTGSAVTTCSGES